MCGILAIVGEIQTEKIAEKNKKLLEILNHRGPDDFGYYYDKYVFLGHRRLSIIDLSSEGKQPLKYSNEDLFIVFNGEIYNYLEIKQEIEEMNPNIQFKSKTDTEVILAAYEFYGNKFLSKLNGMFSFLIYDKKRSKIIVARDRFGIKPLYYCRHDNFIIFSSEIKAIKRKLNNKIEVNERIIYDYLVYGRVDHTDQTFYKNIYR